MDTTQPRQVDRAGDSRASGERRIGLFIDYEGVRRGLAAFLNDGLLFARRVHELAVEHGRVVLAAAYGDWGEARQEARDLRRYQIEPRFVLGKEPGDDRTDLVLSLDVQETLFLGPDIDLFVLVIGDDGYHDLVQRLRKADRAVIVVGIESASAHAAYRGRDRFVPLEELLGARSPRRLHRPDFSAYDWTPFVRLMMDLEKNMPFVGFGWLLKKKLGAENSGCYTMQDKQELMDRAVEESILILYKVDNIEEGADPVTACKLNRDTALVRDLVGQD